MRIRRSKRAFVSGVVETGDICRDSLIGVRCQFVAGDLYFIQPGQTHREKSLKEPLDFYALRFQLNDLKGKQAHFIPPLENPRKQILRKVDRVFFELFERVFQEVWDQNPGCEEVVEAIILQMTWLVRRRLKAGLPRLSPARITERQRILVEAAKQYIQAHLNRSLSLAELGRACCASPDHLRHLFKEATGTSPMQYAVAHQMEEAKRLLADQTLAIYEVAEQLGFSDPYYFSRKFKQVTQLSPKAFREKL